MYQFDKGAWVDIHHEEEGLFGMVLGESGHYVYKVFTPLGTRDVDGRRMVLSTRLDPEDKVALMSMLLANVWEQLYFVESKLDG